MIRVFCVWLSVFLLMLLALPVARAVPFFTAGPGLPAVLSLSWDPAAGQYGLFLALLGSIELVLLSLPLSVAIAWALTYQLSHTKLGRLRAIVLSALQAANSVPSVVIGIWGIDRLVPMVRDVAGTGYCMLTATLALVVMGLPTTCLLLLQAYETYRAKYDGLERSLGFTWLDSTRYFLRTARSDLRHVWLYTFCRLFGETTVVLMLSGNSLVLPGGVFDGFRTLTSSIALEMAYASGKHEQALYVLATVNLLCTAAAITFGTTRRRRLVPATGALAPGASAS